MSTTQSTQERIDTLWYTRCPVPTPLGLASQLGWIADEFRPEGITIKTLQETSDPTLRERKRLPTLHVKLARPINGCVMPTGTTYTRA